jgi:hypothetical protein
MSSKTRTPRAGSFYGAERILILLCVFVAMILTVSGFLAAQTPEDAPDAALDMNADTDADTDADTGRVQELPSGYGQYGFGLSLEEVKELLGADISFAYRGDPDVQMLPVRRSPVIETAGTGFITRGYFQFRDDALYMILLELQPGRLDYYTMYRTLQEKYGEPARLSPVDMVWETESVRLVLERPLTVKYLDLEAFREIRDEARVEQSLREISRDRFLEKF